MIANDIDMNGVSWYPIGPRNGGYGGQNGTIDGQGHVLSNFSVNGTYLWPGAIKNRQIGVIGCFYGTIKNLTFENITINGLNGAFNTNEYAYYAAPVAYSYANMENVHSKHVIIKGSGVDGVQRQNIGGLIGYQGEGYTIKNCSAEDIHLAGIQCGGLVGSLQSNNTLESCSTNYVYLRIGTPTADKGISDGGFIGDVVNGTNVIFKSCTAPTVVEYLNDADGTPNTTYTVANPLYGNCRANADKISIQ
jgi:hypothetical protein